MAVHDRATTPKPPPSLHGSMAEKKRTLPPQRQDRQPGLESEMRPKPRAVDGEYEGSGKLDGKVALITGGDSGIGRAVANFFAKEGADVAIAYLDEHEDAEEAKRLVEQEGRRCITLAGDVGRESFCRDAIARTVEELGRLDVLVPNAAEQHERDDLTELSEESLERTFRTNVFAHFFLVKHALPHLREGSTIIMTTSVTAYQGNPTLLDYSVTKGAIVSLVRSLSLRLVDKGIRVNGVAPGPVWTPLIPASFDEEHVETFGSNYPMGRPAMPEEIAPAYVFLASDDASFMSGQILHPNGGKVVNG